MYFAIHFQNKRIAGRDEFAAFGRNVAHPKSHSLWLLMQSDKDKMQLNMIPCCWAHSYRHCISEFVFFFLVSK